MAKAATEAVSGVVVPKWIIGTFATVAGLMVSVTIWEIRQNRAGMADNQTAILKHEAKPAHVGMTNRFEDRMKSVDNRLHKIEGSQTTMNGKLDQLLQRP